MVDYYKYSKERIRARLVKKQRNQKFQETINNFMKAVYNQTRLRGD